MKTFWLQLHSMIKNVLQMGVKILLKFEEIEIKFEVSDNYNNEYE